MYMIEVAAKQEEPKILNNSAMPNGHHAASVSSPSWILELHNRSASEEMRRTSEVRQTGNRDRLIDLLISILNINFREE